jgi:hypothetical protein
MAALLLIAGAGCGSDGGGSATPLSATPVSTIPGPYDHNFTIPLGTADKIAAGDDVDVMPTSLDAKVGETIRIVNDDVESHTVGTFYVLAGTTLTYRFTAAGVFEGACSADPGGEFLLTVVP